MSEVVLFDLPSNGRASCWSMNPWKTRLVLNFKKIPYETDWTEFPDIESKLKDKYGVPPHPVTNKWTIPTIHIPNEDKFIMDSKEIATYLEKKYPSPSLHLDSPALPRVEETWSKLVEALSPNVFPIVGTVLPPRSKEWVENRYAAQFGKMAAEREGDSGGEQAWERTQLVCKELGKILTEADGPFILGETASYADLLILAILSMLKRVNENALNRVLSYDEALARLYESSSGWTVRDN